MFSASCVYDIITICHQNSARSAEYDLAASVYSEGKAFDERAEHQTQRMGIAEIS